MTPTTYTEVNQCCISDQWITIDVLEEGYGHGFGLRGLRDEFPKPSPHTTVTSSRGVVAGGVLSAKNVSLGMLLVHSGAYKYLLHSRPHRWIYYAYSLGGQCG